MPIYDYTCSSCGHEEERLVKLSQVAKQTCSECGKATNKNIVQSQAHAKHSSWSGWQSGLTRRGR